MVEEKNLEEKCNAHKKGALLSSNGTIGRYICRICKTIYSDTLTRTEKSKSNNYENEPVYF